MSNTTLYDRVPRRRCRRPGPRAPILVGGPVFVSRVVWCSISASISVQSPASRVDPHNSGRRKVMINLLGTIVDFQRVFIAPVLSREMVVSGVIPGAPGVPRPLGLRRSASEFPGSSPRFTFEPSPSTVR
jgi:hypothetical protein